MTITIPYWPRRAIIVTFGTRYTPPAAPAVEVPLVNDSYLTTGYSSLRLGASRPAPGAARALPARGLFVDPVDQDIEERRNGVRIGGAS